MCRHDHACTYPFFGYFSACNSLDMQCLSLHGKYPCAKEAQIPCLRCGGPTKPRLSLSPSYWKRLLFKSELLQNHCPIHIKQAPHDGNNYLKKLSLARAFMRIFREVYSVASHGSWKLVAQKTVSFVISLLMPPLSMIIDPC